MAFTAIGYRIFPKKKKQKSAKIRTLHFYALLDMLLPIMQRGG
jgi:hypothetical protein